MSFTILTAPKEEHELFFYSQGKSEKAGVIGYMRGYFDSDDWLLTSWFDIQKELKTEAMQAELDKIVEYLTKSEEQPLFKSRRSMFNYYLANTKHHISGSIGGEAYGFKIKTAGVTYYVRYFPNKGDYNAYIFVYDNEYLTLFHNSEETEVKKPVVDNPYSDRPAQEIYEELRKLGADKGGWELYYVAKEITNIDIYKVFHEGAGNGWFSQIDGYETLRWLERAAFPSNIREDAPDSPNLECRTHIKDITSREYVEFEKNLYPLALENVITKINKADEKYAEAKEYLANLASENERNGEN
ncbi:MAG: hypothetical protein FWD48_02990 [Oscillospiraceae bacterium]|nr:hypothetical protein [Oscillospiraceae bacterium]